MFTKSPFQTLLVCMFVLIPFAYLGSTYSGLPQTIPTHYNLQGKVDGFGNKSTLWILTFFLGTLSIGLYFLFQFLPKIDPKKSAQSATVLSKLGVAMAAFLCLLQLAIIQSAKGNIDILEKTTVPGVGLLFALIGNYMYSIKPNYFVGLRVPWTLENPENWRRTHQLMSKYWVIGGLLIFLVGLFTTLAYGIVIMGIILSIITIVPIVYSYRLFKTNIS